MAKLYELEGEFLEIYEMDIDDETKRDTLESKDFNERLTEKAEGYAKIIKNLEADEEMYKKAERDFKKKKQQARNKADYLKNRLKEAMIVTRHEKIDGIFKLSLRKTTSVEVFDESKLPEKFIKTEIKKSPMKTEINKAIKNGEIVFGAELKEGRSLVIK